MLKAPLTTSNVDDYIGHLKSLRPDTQPIFGKLDARGMLRHLRFNFEMSVGDVEVEDRSKPILRNILWFLLFHLITTWPGGKLKGPGFAAPPPEFEFDEEREKLEEVMRRFAENLATSPGKRRLEPDFGVLTMTQWSRFHGIHLAHHLRQFKLG